MRVTPVFLHAVILALSATTALAADSKLEVGQKVTFTGSSLEGKRITHKSLSGRVAVIEFWATWCGPCVAIAPEMRKLHATYSEQGVKFLGVSLDRSAAPARTFVKEHNLDWPQILDKQGPTGLAAAWQVRGIPHALILSPSGELLWRGHPAHLEGSLADAVAASKSASSGSNDTHSRAAAAMSASLAALNKLDYQQALSTLGRVSDESLTDPEVLRLGAMLVRRFDAAGESGALQEAQAAEAEGQSRLRSLRAALADLAATSGLPPAPTAHGTLHSVDLARAAALRFERAERQRVAEQHVTAYRLYAEVAQQYGTTDAGRAAAARVAEYERDEAFMQTMRAQQAEDKARAELALARNYLAAESFEVARAHLHKVIENYPDTPSAAEARTIIDALK